MLDGCDAVYVCTWTSEHPRLVSAALDRRLPVFVEKPLATDLAGAGRSPMRWWPPGSPTRSGLVLRRSPVFSLLRPWWPRPAR